MLERTNVVPRRDQWGDQGDRLTLEKGAARRTFRNLADPAVPQAIRDSYVAYFFSKSGYVTVDGSAIVAPIQIGDFDLTMLSGGKGESPLGARHR